VIVLVSDFPFPDASFAITKIDAVHVRTKHKSKLLMVIPPQFWLNRRIRWLVVEHRLQAAGQSYRNQRLPTVVKIAITPIDLPNRGLSEMPDFVSYGRGSEIGARI
jgi:hypothetical protein